MSVCRMKDLTQKVRLVAMMTMGLLLQTGVEVYCPYLENNPQYPFNTIYLVFNSQ